MAVYGVGGVVLCIFQEKGAALRGPAGHAGAQVHDGLARGSLAFQHLQRAQGAARTGDVAMGCASAQRFQGSQGGVFAAVRKAFQVGPPRRLAGPELGDSMDGEQPAVYLPHDGTQQCAPEVCRRRRQTHQMQGSLIAGAGALPEGGALRKARQICCTQVAGADLHGRLHQGVARLQAIFPGCAHAAHGEQLSWRQGLGDTIDNHGGKQRAGGSSRLHAGPCIIVRRWEPDDVAWVGKVLFAGQSDLIGSAPNCRSTRGAAPV